MKGNVSIIYWSIFIVFLAAVFPAAGQGRNFSFRPLTWEQAGSLAVREGKLVFVEVVLSDGAKTAKNIFADANVRHFLDRNTVAIQINADSEAGRAFIPKLLLHQYPLYAFFMPYGDLLETVGISAAVKNPLLLIEAGQRALKLAAVKKNNSRSIQFEHISRAEALDKAKREEKPVFITVYQDNNQSYLLMEKNVFNLDKVADYYNKHFISLKVNADLEKQLVTKYGLSVYPVYLFLNGNGKLLSIAGDYADADTFIGFGQKALEEAKGIVFTPGDWRQIQEKAGQAGKLIFMDFYAPADAKRKVMAKSVYTDPDVSRLFNRSFINTAWNMDDPGNTGLMEIYDVVSSPAFLFVDGSGKIIHQVAGELTVEKLIREAERALSDTGIAYMAEKYENGERETEFVEEYLAMLGRAEMKKTAGEVAREYLSTVDLERLKETKYWDLFREYISDPDTELFRYVYAGRGAFYPLFGEQEVESKIREVWTAGADGFLKSEGNSYHFDEPGFKEYVKRLKKEKAEGWREIVRNTKMSVAEKTGDWRAYVELAEEKWSGEQVPDAELYGWGVKINQQCRDKSIRFKAARWFAFAVEEIARKEVQSGKKNLTSYEGFFRKLIDDLLRE